MWVPLYRDWSNTTFSDGEDVPDSCCLSDVVGCGVGILRQDSTGNTRKDFTLFKIGKLKQGNVRPKTLQFTSRYSNTVATFNKFTIMLFITKI